MWFLHMYVKHGAGPAYLHKRRPLEEQEVKAWEGSGVKLLTTEQTVTFDLGFADL